MVLIGIDPHKASHTAVVVDDAERELARIKVKADRSQVAALLEFADGYRPRRWAIELVLETGTTIGVYRAVAGVNGRSRPVGRLSPGCGAVVCARIRECTRWRLTRGDRHDR